MGPARREHLRHEIHHLRHQLAKEHHLRLGAESSLAVVLAQRNESLERERRLHDELDTLRGADRVRPRPDG